MLAALWVNPLIAIRCAHARQQHLVFGDNAVFYRNVSSGTTRCTCSAHPMTLLSHLICCQIYDSRLLSAGKKKVKCATLFGRMQDLGRYEV